MSEFSFKLPDLGEGTVEAEVVEWYVAVGDSVEEGATIADVMTDKANVEVPAPVTGRVLRLGAHPGDVIAVGAELIAFETDAAVGAKVEAPVQKTSEQIPREEPAPEPEPAASPETETPPEPVPDAAAARRAEGNPKGLRVATSPAIRKHAKEAGVDLSQVAGTGPGGRILRRDLAAYLENKPAQATPAQASAAEPHSEYEDVKVIGLRRLIAQRMTQSNTEIPHFAYIEEIDVTDLEALRKHLNARYEQNLTLLPFLGLAIIRAVHDFPQCNAHYNAADGTLRQFRAVHLGIATQTDQGLKVPVVHSAHTMSVWQLADAMRTAAKAARDGSARVGDLTGSSITLSSLGKLGGIAATPIINYPEVAVLGINKAVPRPVVRDERVEVRTMMNVSGSFDHRFVDGFDAASFVQAIKSSLENPATLWVDAP